LDKVVSGVANRADDLNAEIQKYAIGWDISRISRLTRAIMQLAIYEIQYVDDVLSMTKQLAEQVDEDVESYYNLDLGNVGTLKHRRWEFQKESRFLIRIIPTDGQISLMNPKEFMSKIKGAFDTKMEPHFETYDLSLKDEALDQLEVTLSPSITTGQRVIVESLLKQYAPKAKLMESSLKQYVQMK
jgi:hypothetical protein